MTFMSTIVLYTHTYIYIDTGIYCIYTQISYVCVSVKKKGDLAFYFGKTNKTPC